MECACPEIFSLFAPFPCSNRSFFPSFVLVLPNSFLLLFFLPLSFLRPLSLFVIPLRSILCRVTIVSLPFSVPLLSRRSGYLRLRSVALQIREHLPPPSSVCFFFFFFSRFLVLPATVVIIPFLVANVPIPQLIYPPCILTLPRSTHFVRCRLNHAPIELLSLV